MASLYRNSAPAYELQYTAKESAIKQNEKDRSLTGKIADLSSRLTRLLGEDLIGPFFDLSNNMKKASTERQLALWGAEQDGIARQDEMAYNAQGTNTTKILIVVVIIVVALLIFKFKKK